MATNRTVWESMVEAKYLVLVPVDSGIPCVPPSPSPGLCNSSTTQKSCSKHLPHVNFVGAEGFYRVREGGCAGDLS